MTPAFFQPLVVWGESIAPTLFPLVFLNRSIRAIGVVLLVLMIFLIGGSIAGSAVGSIHGVAKAMVGFTSALGITSGRVVFWSVHLIGMALFAPLGWLVIRAICRRYEAKKFSDQVLVFDSIWLFQTFLLWQGLFFEVGHRAWIALTPFGLYKLISWVGLRPPKSAVPQQSARLLLLRTFGFRRRSERLFDQLSARWRYVGPIQLIAAPDLAGHSIDPAKFLDFLSGRLHRRFVKELPDLDQRIAAFDANPDPDARYRVNELFCGDDAWREAVRRLMETSDLVVMDLRGFTAKNQGCIFELQSLIDHVAIGKIVLLVDERSDIAFLRQTLESCWHKMVDTSPNREGTTAITLLDVGRREASAVDALLSIADELLTKPKTVGLTTFARGEGTGFGITTTAPASSTASH